MRLLLLIIVLGLGIVIIKHLLSTKGKPPILDSRPTPMVRCEQCGVHIPEAEAIRYGELLFCSDEHRKLHQS